MPQGIVKPSNSVIVDISTSEVREVEIGANATAAKMLPGRAVIHDTNDGDVKEAAAKADNMLGVLLDQPDELITHAYAVGEMARLAEAGSGAKVVVTLVTGSAAVAPGDPLVTAADGKFAKQAVAAMGSQGTVFARALETADPTAADKTIVAKLVTGGEPAAAS
jgi:hypothetical protein